MCVWAGWGAHLDVLGEAVEDLLGHGHGLGEVALPLLVDHVLPRVVPVEVADGLLPPDGHHQQWGGGGQGHRDHQQHEDMGTGTQGPPATQGREDGDGGTTVSMRTGGQGHGDHQQHEDMGTGMCIRDGDQGCGSGNVAWGWGRAVGCGIGDGVQAGGHGLWLGGPVGCGTCRRSR